MTCRNCDAKNASCSAAARAFKKGVDEKAGTIWAVCRKCRTDANQAARDAIANMVDWTGTV